MLEATGTSLKRTVIKGGKKIAEEGGEGEEQEQEEGGKKEEPEEGAAAVPIDAELFEEMGDLDISDEE